MPPLKHFRNVGLKYPHPQMKIWADLGTLSLSWSGVPPPLRVSWSSYVETNFCIPRGYHLWFRTFIRAVAYPKELRYRRESSSLVLKCVRKHFCLTRKLVEIPTKIDADRLLILCSIPKFTEIYSDSMNIGKSSQLGKHDFSHCTILIEHVIKMRASRFDTDFLSQMKSPTVSSLNSLLRNGMKRTEQICFLQEWTTHSQMLQTCHKLMVRKT